MLHPRGSDDPNDSDLAALIGVTHRFGIT